MRRLPLGGWHVNHALDVVDADDRLHRLVLRRWARPGWDREDPDYTVERETRVLELLRSTPVPAPAVLGADPTGGRCDVPAMLLTRLPGHPPSSLDAAGEGFCRELAAALAQIHAVAVAEAQLDTYRLYYDPPHATLPGWIPATPVWRRAIAAIRELPAAGPMTFIHRDFHPENTLWSGGRLTAVVDWTQASWGPPALDLGHMRWNLVADHGQDAADRFLDGYRAATGAPLEDQAHWDLVCLFDLLLDGEGPGDITAADLRRFEDYAGGLLPRVG